MTEEPLPPPRTLGKWAILWAAWIVGLGIWALYIAMIFVLVYRAFG